MLKEFEKTAADALEELKKVRDLTGLEEFRIKYLSRKGKITELIKPGRQGACGIKAAGRQTGQ